MSFNFMAAVTICSDFVAPKIKSALFPLFLHLFSMKWWDWMPWSCIYTVHVYSFTVDCSVWKICIMNFLFFLLVHCYAVLIFLSTSVYFGDIYIIINIKPKLSFLETCWFLIVILIWLIISKICYGSSV